MTPGGRSRPACACACEAGKLFRSEVVQVEQLADLLPCASANHQVFRWSGKAAPANLEQVINLACRTVGGELA
jgi:hypothetical protein